MPAIRGKSSRRARRNGSRTGLGGPACSLFQRAPGRVHARISRSSGQGHGDMEIEGRMASRSAGAATLRRARSKMADARTAATRGEMIVQQLAGSFMYLRSMIGPEELLYAFYDQPE